MANDATAIGITLAGAMVSDINARVAVLDESGNTIPRRFTAERKYRADYKPSDMVEIPRVDVVWVGGMSEAISRATAYTSGYCDGASNIVNIWVFVQMCVDARDVVGCDAMANLAARIHGRFYDGLAPTEATVTHPEMVTALTAHEPYQCRLSELETYDYRLLTDATQGFGIWRSIIRTEWIKL